MGMWREKKKTFVQFNIDFKFYSMNHLWLKNKLRLLDDIKKCGFTVKTQNVTFKCFFLVGPLLVFVCLCSEYRKFSHFIFHYAVNGRYAHIHTHTRVTNDFTWLDFSHPLLSSLSLSVWMCAFMEIDFFRLKAMLPFAFWPNRENRFLKPPEKVQYSRLNFSHQSCLYM